MRHHQNIITSKAPKPQTKDATLHDARVASLDGRLQVERSRDLGPCFISTRPFRGACDLMPNTSVIRRAYANEGSHAASTWSNPIDFVTQYETLCVLTAACCAFP